MPQYCLLAHPTLGPYLRDRASGFSFKERAASRCIPQLHCARPSKNWPGPARCTLDIGGGEEAFPVQKIKLREVGSPEVFPHHWQMLVSHSLAPSGERGESLKHTGTGQPPKAVTPSTVGGWGSSLCGPRPSTPET